MAINNAAMQAGANGIQAVLLYGQLHYAPAGTDGTDNVTTADREAITWTTPVDDGDFGLSVILEFSGGEPDGDVYSITFWDASSDGSFYGETPLTGDHVFSSLGSYQVTVLDFDGYTEDVS